MKIYTVILFSTISITAFAQDCDNLRKSPLYFSATSSGATENEARINALSLLAENISSVVSSRTYMLTKDDGTTDQKFYNVSKSTSVLHLKGVSYLTCYKNKKSGATVLAFISKKDLSQSSAEVADRVGQYIELMEQKESKGVDFLPEAYIAYLHTFMSPYTIDYHSDTRHISNVRGYLESFLRTFLSNVSVTCTGVTENSDYPDQQLTLSLALGGTNGTRMSFLVNIPEYSAQGSLDQVNNTMDVIMTPEGRTKKFSGTLSLTPPPVEAELKDISDRVRISRDISFEAGMSDLIKLDFNMRERGDNLLLTPKVRHLTLRQFEWISGGRLLSTEQRPTLPAAGLKEITLRINGSRELMITKIFDSPFVGDSTRRRSAISANGPSISIELIQGHKSSTPYARDVQESNPFPEDAMVLIETDISNLIFSSSMSAIDRQTYNNNARRYEIFVKAVKQIFFVEAEGIIEKNMGVINPQPKDAIWFRINAVPPETLITKGLISITSDPPDASIFINDIETVYRTPFTIMIADGITKISLHKKYYQLADTVISVDSSRPVDVKMTLARQPEDIRTSDELSYLKGRSERIYYQEMNVDALKPSLRSPLVDYQRKISFLKRKAALSYSIAALGITSGVYYGWLDRLLYNNTRSSAGHSPLLSSMATGSYVLGGVGLLTGIIYSTKIARLKKNWTIAPVPNARGMGLLVVYKF